jgi:acyl-CoA thioesterase-1
MIMRGAERLLAALLSLFLFACLDAAQARPLKRVLIFGDSLASGFDLPEGTGFAWSLRRQLYRRGHGDVQVMNSSRAGDDTAVGVDRIPLAFSRGADLVIVELGGNDMRSDVEPGVVYRNLQTIIAHSKAQGARVILAGMLSLPKRDPTYKQRFDSLYPALAAREKVPLYPFFLDGAFGNSGLMQRDGAHPNAAGSEVIAARMAPLVDRELRALDGAGNGFGAYGRYGYAGRRAR